MNEHSGHSRAVNVLNSSEEIHSTFSPLCMWEVIPLSAGNWPSGHLVSRFLSSISPHCGQPVGALWSSSHGPWGKVDFKSVPKDFLSDKRHSVAINQTLYFYTLTADVLFFLLEGSTRQTNNMFILLLVPHGIITVKGAANIISSVLILTVWRLAQEHGWINNHH